LSGLGEVIGVLAAVFVTPAVEGSSNAVGVTFSCIGRRSLNSFLGSTMSTNEVEQDRDDGDHG
jgi:hypothetical protein